jgi:hypothetical protein
MPPFDVWDIFPNITINMIIIHILIKFLDIIFQNDLNIYYLNKIWGRKFLISGRYFNGTKSLSQNIFRPLLSWTSIPNQYIDM